MSDKELEEYIKKVEPNFSSHIENGTIEMSNEYYNLIEERMARLTNKNQELEKENKELSHIIANKVISDYNIDIPLKKELGDANLKIVSLEDAIHCYKQEKEDLIKWLEDKIKESEKVIDILNKPLYAEEIKKEVSINPIIPKVIAANFLITLDKVRGDSNGKI